MGRRKSATGLSFDFVFHFLCLSSSPKVFFGSRVLLEEIKDGKEGHFFDGGNYVRNFFQSPKGAVRKQRAERAEAKHLVGKSNLVKRFFLPFFARL